MSLPRRREDQSRNPGCEWSMNHSTHYPSKCELLLLPRWGVGLRRLRAALQGRSGLQGATKRVAAPACGRGGQRCTVGR